VVVKQISVAIFLGWAAGYLGNPVPLATLPSGQTLSRDHSQPQSIGSPLGKSTANNQRTSKKEEKKKERSRVQLFKTRWDSWLSPTHGAFGQV
jgi:hypothetical protein